MNAHTKKLFDRALDQAVPETWTQLSHEQMTRLSSVFAELIIMDVANKLEPVLASEILELYGVE